MRFALITLLAIFFSAVCASAQDKNVEFKPNHPDFEEEDSTLAQDEEHSEEGKESHTTKIQPVKKQTFKGFGSFRNSFKNICDLINADNQLLLVSDFIKDKAKNEKDCRECKNLYVTMASVCIIKPTKVPAKKAKKKEENSEESEAESENEVTPIPVEKKPIPRLYPSTELLDALSKLSFEMTEKEDFALIHFQTLKKLVEFLRTPSGKTPAEKNYYDVFSEYLLSAFISQGYDKVPEAAKPAKKASSQPAVDVDSLFE